MARSTVGRYVSLFGAAIALILAGQPAVTGQTAAQTAAPRRVVVHAGRLIDGVSQTARERVSIVIEGERITGVENGFTRPAGAEVVDLSTATVLPGLIDAHTHVFADGYKVPYGIHFRHNATQRHYSEYGSEMNNEVLAGKKTMGDALRQLTQRMNNEIEAGACMPYKGMQVPIKP